MMLGLRLLCFILISLSLHAADQPSAASLAAAVHQLSLNPKETYRVRDIHWDRGDVNFYLNEGILSFAAPVDGRTIAAVFTAEEVEAGDAEIVVSPKGTGERASLAYFTRTPNLDEHFSRAVFLFTDATYEEIRKQIEAGVVRSAPEMTAKIVSEWQARLRNIAGDIDIPFISSLFSGDPPGLGLFDALISGRTLGAFDVIYDPHQAETTTIGQVATVDQAQQFQVWTSFAPRRRTIPLPEDPLVIDEYRIDATIRPDLRVDAITRFHATPRRPNHRALDLQLSQVINVTAASLDGKPAEVLQHKSVRGADENDVGRFLVVSSQPLTPGKAVDVEIHQSGTFVKDQGNGTYFVDARNIWFPNQPSRQATVDLTFRCPANLRVVSTGRLISEVVEGATRVVHRRVDTPVRLAGFNLGDFVGVKQDHKPFQIECFANRALLDQMNGLPVGSGAAPIAGVEGARQANFPPSTALQKMCTEAGGILGAYAARWGPLPIQNIAVTPIAGSFGQGFPGLIYLSTISYLPTELRPAALRNSILNIFFSNILLAHELAHQWWGNLVTPSDYRSDWIVEALSNYAALQLYEEQNGSAALDKVMLYYVSELTEVGKDRKTVESTGPVDLGTRLKGSIGENSWRVITYDKGTWVIHMLHRRLGDRAFASLLRNLAAKYAGKTLSNEEFRQAACRFLPKGDPDPSLELFFDAWVYGTGIPKLALVRGHSNDEYTLIQSGVPEYFNADVPITVTTKGHSATVKWVRSSSDGTAFRVPALTTKVSLPILSEFLHLQ